MSFHSTFAREVEQQCFALMCGNVMMACTKCLVSATGTALDLPEAAALTPLKVPPLSPLRTVSGSGASGRPSSAAAAAVKEAFAHGDEVKSLSFFTPQAAEAACKLALVLHPHHVWACFCYEWPKGNDDSGRKGPKALNANLSVEIGLYRTGLYIGVLQGEMNWGGVRLRWLSERRRLSWRRCRSGWRRLSRSTSTPATSAKHCGWVLLCFFDPPDGVGMRVPGHACVQAVWFLWAVLRP